MTLLIKFYTILLLFQGLSIRQKEKTYELFQKNKTFFDFFIEICYFI